VRDLIKKVLNQGVGGGVYVRVGRRKKPGWQCSFSDVSQTRRTAQWAIAWERGKIFFRGGTLLHACMESEGKCGASRRQEGERHLERGGGVKRPIPSNIGEIPTSGSTSGPEFLQFTLGRPKVDPRDSRDVEKKGWVQGRET